MLPQEDGAEFAGLEAALLEELAPTGALQTLLARRVAVAAWRLERADRLETEVLEFRSYDAAGPGLALIRDGNGTRSLETLLRYRNAAMAEFWRALRTLKALQAEHAQQAAEQAAQAATSMGASAPHPETAGCRAPNEPEGKAQHRLECVLPDQPTSGHALHETVAPRGPEPKEPERAAVSLAPREDRAMAPTRAGVPHRGASAPGPWPRAPAAAHDETRPPSKAMNR